MVMPEEPPENAPASDNLQLVKIPDSAVQAVESDREGNLPVVPEKPSEDGYNWRKYGQKNVKGNEFIRSYYKCSYPNCQVKKQVERTHDGRITDTSYFGVHEHPKAHSSPRAAVPALLSVQVQIPDCPPLPATEENSSDAHKTASHNVEPKITREVSTPAAGDHGMHTPRLPSSEPRDDVDNSENLITKRRKKGNDNAETIGDKTGSESRVVVHTVSEVDIVNDGHRWRKYGQKMVKGNPHPRSYYRCSTTGCPAKKHVERASYDQKVVITTYEGQHDHSTPPLRTIHSISPLKPVLPESAPVIAASSPNAIDKSKSVKSDAAQNGRTTSKPEEDTSDHKPKEDSDTMTGVETKVKVVTLTEHQQTSSETEWDLPPAVETKPDPPPEVKTKLGPPPEVETKHEACPASSASETKQHEQQCPDSVFTSSCPETNPNGQHKVDSAEPVNC